VRKLANSLLFDYHDAIRDLRGARPVRERMVRDALGYLDGLAKEAKEDPTLQRELAGAYDRIGDLQGGEPSSLGDTDGAAVSYGKAVEILETLLRADSTSRTLRRDAANSSLALGRVVWGRGDVAGGLEHVRRARLLLHPLVAASPSDTGLRWQLSAANNLLGQISLEEGKIDQSLQFHRTDLEQLLAAPPSQHQLPEMRYAVSVTSGYLADALVEAGDLTGALENHRRSRALRRALSDEFPDNVKYAEAAGAARYYEATVLGKLGRWEEALALHRESLAEDSTGSFTLCRIGEALAALNRGEEALTFLRRALRKHAQELRADTANLFTRLAIVEDTTRVCKVLATLGSAQAPSACIGATRFAERIAVEPDHAFARGFVALAWADLGEAFERLTGLSGVSEADLANYRLSTREQFRRSRDIWADLKRRGLVSPVDTGRLAEAERALCPR
jgi:tetratricopeptide (TPR) repeat protein